MIDIQILNRDYSELKLSVERCVSMKKYEEATKLIKLASTIAYSYNFLQTFSDTELETYLDSIARAHQDVVTIYGKSQKVIFYDSFGYDNRGLTQQYIRAFISLNYDIVYILGEPPHPNFKSGDIYSELTNYPACTIYIQEQTENIPRFIELVNIIEKESPSKIFMHLSPWDVSAYMGFCSVKNVTRYQINLTDHAFWLGVRITDICLEFRSFGYELSKVRGILEQKLFILPYYPIINNHSFEGFPIDLSAKKIICSGGTTYKILGESLIFLELVRKTLALDDSLVFLYVGPGTKTPMVDYFRKNNLQERVLILDDRKDINAVISNIDYYFDTYPFSGGLMSLIVGALGKPIFFYSPPGYERNNLDDLFYKRKEFYKFSTETEFVEGFKDVYNNENIIKDYSESLKTAMINPVEFSQALEKILNGGTPYNYLHKNVGVKDHCKKISSFLLESENEYNPNYKKLILVYLTPYQRRKYMRLFFNREQKYNWKFDKSAFFRRLIRSFVK